MRMWSKSLLVLCASLSLAACTKKEATAPPTSSDLPNVVMNTEAESTSSHTSGNTVTIRAIGDILLHDSVYNNGRTETGYSFDHMFEAVKPYIENADISIANLETIAAGNALGVSTYPTFNAPEEIIDTLKNYLGIDIVNNATNHTMDRGVEGALASIKALQERDMMYVGSYESWDDYNTPRIIEKNGIKVGFLSYSYGTNGNYLPEDQTYLDTLIDTELIPLEVELLNEKVDVSVVIFQNGEEYEYLPSLSQLQVNQITRDAGANFILGGHPHVVQPFMLYNESQAAILSHGNFLSGQVETDTKIGGITEVTYRKTNDGRVLVESMRFMPTYNFGLPESADYYVVPLADWEKYGIPNGEELFNNLQRRMRYYTNKVEVVDYLD